MWQKARIIENPLCNNQGTTGKEVWVKGPPLAPDGEYHDSVSGHMSWRIDTPHFETNLEIPEDKLWIDSRAVELLPEFANDVPMVQWEDFIK